MIKTYILRRTQRGGNGDSIMMALSKFSGRRLLYYLVPDIAELEEMVERNMGSSFGAAPVMAAAPDEVYNANDIAEDDFYN